MRPALPVTDQYAYYAPRPSYPHPMHLAMISYIYIYIYICCNFAIIYFLHLPESLHLADLLLLLVSFVYNHPTIVMHDCSIAARMAYISECSQI